MKLRYSFSNEMECETIHAYSLRILENTGFVVHSPDARKVFKHKGARISGKKVFLSAKLVEEYLSLVPSTFTLHSPHHRVTLGMGELCTLPTYGATYVRHNNQIHSASRDDFINFSKLNHLNERISMACPYILEPFDIPLEYREDYRMAMSLKYSDKPTFSITRDGVSATESIRFTQDFWDDHDHYLLMGNINISAPLIMGEGTADVILSHGKANQPLMIACGSGLSGLTAPPTPASNFLISNAATLSGIVLSQMVRPGLPIVYGFPLFAVDPFNANVAIGNPITALFTMASTEMGRFYHIPVRSGGVYTDSKFSDYQSGLESFMHLFSCLFSKVDCLMHTLGMEDSLNTLSYNKYILDEALFDSVWNYLKGFEINDVTLMLDEIEKTGSSGNYINARNLRLIRKQYPTYPYKNNETPQDFAQKTDKIINDRLEHYTPLPITKTQQDLINKVIPPIYSD